MSSFQDWNIINIGNPSKKIYPKEIVERREEVKKIDENPDSFRIKTIPPDLSKEIISVRNTIKLTQKEFANKLNIQPSIYSDIENGKAIYNANTSTIIQKIERIFNVKLQNKKVKK
jgi:ribosome-binding protein aMBF1 (putative translation factor)